jgi:hypothetical protein
MPNFTAGTSFSDGVTNDVTAAKLNALVADAVPTSSLALTSTNGTISNFTSSTATITGAITGSTNVVNIGSGQIYKDASGNVGIGTESPASKLVVSRSANDNLTRIVLDNSNAGSSAQTILGLSNDGGTVAGLKLGSSTYSGAGGANALDLFNNASHTILSTSGSERLRIDSSGNLLIGATTANSVLPLANRGYAQINGTTDCAFGFTSNGTLGGYIYNTSNEFRIANYSNNILTMHTNNTERLRINANGSLLIGTTSETTGVVKLKLSDGTIDSVYGYKTAGVEYAGTLTNHPYAILTNNTERLRIDSSGNVGIGTASPAYPLVVSSAASTQIQIRAGNANASSILFGDTDSAAIGRIQYDHGTNSMAMWTNSAERLSITSDGEVYIAGTTDQGAYNLQVNGTGVWGAGAYVNGSDERLKENIQNITSGLDVIEKLRPVTFNYKSDFSTDTSTQAGFIAQDLLVALDGKNYIDGTVSQGPTYYNVAYQTIIPILTKAIQELKSENDSLKSRIEALEAA